MTVVLAPGAPRRASAVSLALAPVPSRAEQLAPEPPSPSQLAAELEYAGPDAYRHAVETALQQLQRARRALAQRHAQLAKAEARAEQEQAETAETYARQLRTIQARYASWVLEAHARHEATRRQAAGPRLAAEAALAAACAAAGAHGELRLEARRLGEARAVARGLGQLAKRTLGLGGLGDWRALARGLAPFVHDALERRDPETAAMVDALLQAVLRTHAIQARAQGPEQARALVAEMKALTAPMLASLWRAQASAPYQPAPLGQVFGDVARWLRGAEPGAAEAALDRLRLDVEMVARQSERSLKAALALTPAEPEAAGAISRAEAALSEAERLEQGLAQAASAALGHDLSYLEREREKGARLADALVVGMDQTAGRALAEARAQLGRTRALEQAWLDELRGLEQAPSAWERFAWRTWHGLDLGGFWVRQRGALG